MPGNFNASMYGYEDLLWRATRLRDAASTSELAWREGNRLRSIIVQQFREQKPASGPGWRPLQRLTIAERELEGFHGNFIMVRSAAMRNGIEVVRRKGQKEVFVGILRKSRARARRVRPGFSRKGVRRRKAQRKGQRSRRLADVARVMEFGTRPVAVRITPAMRGFLFGVLYRWARTRAAVEGKKPGFIVYQVPARPVFRPAAKKWEDTLNDSLRRYFAARMRGV